MLPSSRELILDSPISRMSLLTEDTLGVLTDGKELNIVDLSTLRIKKRVPFPSNDNSDFNYHARPLAIKDKLIYMKLTAHGKGLILNIEGKVDKQSSFNYNEDKHVTQAIFSEDTAYLVTGNEEGRTNVINSIDGSLVFEFPYSTDAISAIDISPQNKHVVSSSFDTTIEILNLNSYLVSTFKEIDSIVEDIKFINEDAFLVITKDGRIIKVDAENKTILKEVKFTDNLWPSKICLSDSKNFVYIGTRESTIYALHVDSLEIMFSASLNKSGITDMVRTPTYFIIGYKTGEVEFYNHREYEKKFILAIKLKNIQEAISIFDQNIFLMTHRETKGIYDAWIEIKDSIVQLMSNQEIQEAQKLASGFEFYPKCKKEMREIEELQPELAALQRHIRSSAYGVAYSIVERNPALKSTILYTTLEDIWNKALSRAQIFLSRDPVHNKEKAMEVLSKFNEAESKKDLIDKMINNASIFKRAELAIKNKNFSLYFKLVSENKFLELTIVYKKVISLAEKIKLNTITFLKDENYVNAIESAKLLNQFRPLAQEAIKLEEFINTLMLLDYHVKHKNLLEAVKIQDKIKMQSNYKPIYELEKMKKDFEKSMMCEIQSRKFDSVFMKIKNFFGMRIFEKEISKIVKSLYVKQMEMIFFENRKKVDWEKTLKNYTKYFDLDNDIIGLYSKLEISMPIENFRKEKKDDFPQNIIIYT